MLEKDLTIQFDEKTIYTCQTNHEYGFEIKALKLEKEGFQLVFTSGLSNTPQSVDDANKALERIEILFCLPNYFNLENDSWPISWLDKIAAIPQKNNTWLGNGDSIPAGNPPQAISDKFMADHFILMEPNFTQRYLNKNVNCSYLAVVPIFNQELDFKMRNSHTVLFNKFMKKGITEMVDVYRSSVCRKRILGLI